MTPAWVIRFYMFLLLVVILALAALAVRPAKADEYCHITVPFSVTGSTDLYTAQGRIAICGVVIVNLTTAQLFSLVEGIGSTCATNKVALMGGTSASIGLGSGGVLSAVTEIPWMITGVKGDHLCILLSGSTNVSGVITLKEQ